jgi:hypothetical protein
MAHYRILYNALVIYVCSDVTNEQICAKNTPNKAAAIGWSRGCTTRSQKCREQRTTSSDRSPSKLPGTSVREVSSIKVNASLKTQVFSYKHTNVCKYWPFSDWSARSCMVQRNNVLTMYLQYCKFHMHVHGILVHVHVHWWRHCIHK